MTVRLPMSVVASALCATLLSFAPRTPLRAQSATEPPSSDSVLVPLTTRWPSRTGIAALAPNRVNPMTVEATSDGWVVITPLTRWPDARDEVPSAHLYVTPADVERWTGAARDLLASLVDATRAPAEGNLPGLGRGRIQFVPYYRLAGSRGILLQLARCDGVYETVEVTPLELEALAVALDRATAVARQREGRPSGPTLDRPYYASEVSCAARREVDGEPPRFPSTTPHASRRYTEVGVRFVVDTSGFVERGSVALLPGAPAELAAAARSHVEGWRYRTAEWSGIPVRQIVTTSLAFDPEEEDTRRDPARVATARAEKSLDPAILPFRRQSATFVRADGGLVRVRSGRWRPDGVFDGYQEWFHPDSVDEWVARTRELIAADSAAPRRAPPPRDYSAISLGPARLGNRLVAQYQNGWSSDTERLKLFTVFTGCAGAAVNPATLDRRLLEQLAAAARSARRDRASELPVDRVYGRGELSCPSFLPPTSVAREDMPGVWRYPRGPYSAALARANVRAEILTSFVVDTAGAASAATLVVAPGADPRAVAALRESIERVRFQPATRAGVRVSSRLIRTWLFEPPAQCADERDGIACARPYVKER